MPRRSTRQPATTATPEEPSRTTRRSLRAKAPEKKEEEEEEEDVPPSPAKSDASKSSKRSVRSTTATPTKSTPEPKGRGKRAAGGGDSAKPAKGRGRGRAQSRGRGRNAPKEEEDSDEEEEEEEDGPSEEDEDFSPKKSPRSTSRGRGRGRGAAAAKPSPRVGGRKPRQRKPAADEVDDEEEEEEEEVSQPEVEVKKKRTPSKSPSKPSPRKSARSASKPEEKEEDQSPRRRSGRKAAKEAEEKIRTEAEIQDAKEEEEESKEEEGEKEAEKDEAMDTDGEVKEMAEEETDEGKGTKRKHEDVEDDKDDKAESPKKQKTDEGASAQIEKKVETKVPPPAVEEISEESAGEEPAKDDSSEEAMEEEVKAEEAGSSPVKEAASADSEVTEPSPVKQSPEKAKSVESSPVKESSVPDSSPVKQQTPEKAPSVEQSPAEKAEPVEEQSPEKTPSVDQSPAKEPLVGSSPVKESSVKQSPVKVVEPSLVEETPAELPETLKPTPVQATETEPISEAETSESETKEAAELAEESAPVLTPEPAQLESAQPESAQPELSSVEAMDTSENAESVQDKEHLEDYVVVNMEDVPPAESSEVSTSIPEVRVTPPEQDNGVDHGAENNVDEQPPQAADSQNATNSVEFPTSNNEQAQADCNNIVTSPTESVIKASPTKLESQDPLFCRRFIPNPTIDSSCVAPEKTFTLVSYNTLADCHAERSDYEWISPEHLSLEHRHRRVAEELRHLDADVICLQEVGPDHYAKLLQPQLAQYGYQGAYVKRPDKYYDEGECTFVRTSRFTIQQTELLDLSVVAKKDLEASGLDENVLNAMKEAVSSPAVAVVCKLQCANTGKNVTIANVHIMWEWFKRMDVQCVQAAATIRELVTLAGGAEQPHIICGDFNAIPGSPVYQLTQEGYLNDKSMATLQGVQTVKLSDRMCPMVNLWWRGFQHTSSNVSSAYATTQGSEPRSSKFPHDGGVRAVDYIWYSGSTLDVLGVAETAPESSIQQGIPNATYPSDHVSLKAQLAFRN